jgi:hypothetical protein
MRSYKKINGYNFDFAEADFAAASGFPPEPDFSVAERFGEISSEFFSLRFMARASQ